MSIGQIGPEYIDTPRNKTDLCGLRVHRGEPHPLWHISFACQQHDDPDPSEFVPELTLEAALARVEAMELAERLVLAA